MKKLIALLVVMGLLVGVAGVFTADAAVAKKAPAKKVVKKVVKKAVKKAAPKKAAPKKAAPAPVAPVPPPPPVVTPAPKAAAPTGGLFGLGLNCSVAGDYINTGKGQLSGAVGVSGGIMLDDPLALGTMVGLSANAVKYTVGLGYYQGGGGIKAVPVSFGGIVVLPADLMGAPLFVKGGLNYVVTGNGSKAGKLGGDVSVGVMADLGLGLGKTAFALGYGVVRSDSKTAKGLSFTVTQPFVL